MQLFEQRESKSLGEIDRIEEEENMKRKLSKFSIILIGVGIFVAYMAYQPINIDIWG